jgi:hypothetical protein
MLFRRLVLVGAALVLLVPGAGCTAKSRGAGVAPPAEWIRNTRLDPWRPIGVSPDAGWVEHALREAAVYEVFEECPLRLLDCGTPQAPEALEVSHVRCVAVDESMDRCSFRLTETRPGENGAPARSARSRCTGHFTPLGTSHSPWEWGLASWEAPPPSCTRSR